MVIIRRRLPQAIGNGFTLIELVMVITISAILALTAYPLLTAPSQYSLDNAINVLESDINLTQVSAMSKGISRSIIFSKGSGEYFYDSNENGDDGSSRNLAELGGSISMASDSIITFNSLGEPMSVSDISITIINGDDERKVVVAPYTGKTKIK